MTLRGIAETVLAVAAVAGGVTAWVERNAARSEHIAGLNAVAAKDTTIHRLVGDSAVARRQAEQLTVQLNAKTHESNERGVALTNLTLTVQDLQRRTTGTAVTSAAGLLTLSGILDAWDTAGVRLRATATVPVVTSVTGDHVAKGVESAWTWDLERRPLSLTVDFACRRDTAVVHVVGPPWAHTDISRAVQDAAACNPAPRWSPFSLQLPSVPIGIGLFVLGWIAHR